MLNVEIVNLDVMHGRKEGGACNGCNAFLKPSKSVYICDMEMCANELCLDCYNVHRSTM